MGLDPFVQVRAARNPAGAVATGSKAREMRCLFFVPRLRNRLMRGFWALVVPDRRHSQERWAALCGPGESSSYPVDAPQRARSYSVGDSTPIASAKFARWRDEPPRSAPVKSAPVRSE